MEDDAVHAKDDSVAASLLFSKLLASDTDDHDVDKNHVDSRPLHSACVDPQSEPAVSFSTPCDFFWGRSPPFAQVPSRKAERVA